MSGNKAKVKMQWDYILQINYLLIKLFAPIFVAPPLWQTINSTKISNPACNIHAGFCLYAPSVV